MPLAQHNDIIQAIPPDQADQPFRISVLPCRSRCSRPVTNAHRLKAADENIAVGGRGRRIVVLRSSRTPRSAGVRSIQPSGGR